MFSLFYSSLRVAITLYFLFHLSLVHAGNNAAPLGLEIGVSTLKQVQATIGNQTKLYNDGINKFSGGKMLTGNGKGLDVDGLSEILFIFDNQERLAAISMTLNKAFFEDTLNSLSKKYRIITKEIPFVGNKYAKLKQGNSTIELNAPHLSFTMELLYISDNLLSTFNKERSEEVTKRENEQASKF